MGTRTRSRGSIDTTTAPHPEGVSPEPSGYRPEEPAEVLIKEARRRQRRRWGLFALAIAVAISAGASALASSGSPPPPRKPRRTDKGNGHVGQPVALPSMPWPARAVASTPHIRSVVAMGASLYWITGASPTTSPTRTCSYGPTVPVRYEPKSGKTQRGPAMADCPVELVATKSSLWSLAISKTSFVLEALDPVTLAVTRTETFARTASPTSLCAEPSCATLAAGPGPVLWLTNGTRIWRLDATTGAVEGGFTPRASASALAPGPTGAVLYTSGKNPTGNGAAVDEYSVSSGAQLAHLALPASVVSGPTQLAAGPDNVWTSYRGGMAGGASNLSATGLVTLSHPATPRTPTGRVEVQLFSHIMGVEIASAGGSLWLDSFGVLGCVDPSSGAIRAFEQLGTSSRIGFAAVLSGRLYGYDTIQGNQRLLVSVRAPGACFSQR